MGYLHQGTGDRPDEHGRRLVTGLLLAGSFLALARKSNRARDYKNKEDTKMIEKMTGYKATDKDMRCQGYQFKLGEWHEHKGELVMCKSGFHFCKYPSGPLCFYPLGSRVFKVEAEEILDEPETPGADLKLVARRIRLVEEITPGGHWNTGDSNIGHRNTGHGNTGDFHSGLFNRSPEPLIIFDLPADVNRNSLPSLEIYELSRRLSLDSRFDYKDSMWLKIPNATPERIKALHNAHIRARAAKK